MTGIRDLTASILLLLACTAATGIVQAQSDWERDGLIGPVRRVRTDVALISPSGGKPVEAPRSLLSVEVYDQQGHKKEQKTYPARVLESRQLEQTYRFNERGDISEATLSETDGRVVEQRKYIYEYDPVGNWIKRTISVKNGESNQFVSAEATYRLVIYYLTKEIARAINYEPQDIPPGGGAFFFEPSSKYPPRVFEPMFRAARAAKLRARLMRRARPRYYYYRHGSHYHRRYYRRRRRNRKMKSSPAKSVSMDRGKDVPTYILIAQLDAANPGASSMPTPSVSAVLIDPLVNARRHQAVVRISVTDLQIVDPIEVDEIPKEGQGHIHLQLDDGPILAVPSLRMRLSHIRPGQHTIKVMLHANDHSPLGSHTQLQFHVP